MPKTSWLFLIKCKDLLLLFALKEVLITGWTKQDIWRFQFELWAIVIGIFKVFQNTDISSQPDLSDLICQ